VSGVSRLWAAALSACLAAPAGAAGQAITYRGFAEARGVLFPQDAPNDREHAIGDLLVRAETFVEPWSWLQFAAGVDLRANTHEQVNTSWRPDLADRSTRRPAISVRRLSATLARGAFTVDAGKQFIRWGKADVVTPTDRFAPRDYLNVIDTEFLPVRGVRAVVEIAADTIDAAWIPVFTPSRLPLADQRWTPLPPPAGGDVASVAAGRPPLPDGSQIGVRWSHLGTGYEFSVSVFDGFNHLPTFAPSPAAPATFAVVYPSIRTYGGDVAVPTRWITLKAEAAYFTSSASGADEYVLYVVQLERQAGEWVIVGGYAGEHVTSRRAAFAFAPDRGLTDSLVARAAYSIDPNRSMALEGAIRQDGDGAYAKAEYSQALGARWRATLSGALIAGDGDDFLGQYRRNSHAGAAIRYSF
jgi:hypothetical protein